jgi:carbonic anhydrase
MPPCLRLTPPLFRALPYASQLDQGFGDVFVCRVAGNIATPEEVASLEYAVLDLGVKVILIMGHTSCGAVKAAMSGGAFPGFIDNLLDQLDVAIVRAQSREDKRQAHLKEKHMQYCPDALCTDMLNAVVRENVLYQAERCR